MRRNKEDSLRRPLRSSAGTGLRLTLGRLPTEAAKLGSVLILLLVFYGASACSSRPAPSSEGPRTGPPCPARRVLVVRNNLLVEVEIVESRTGSGSRMVIAYAPPGVQEFAIKNDYQYTYSARPVEGGTTITSTSRSRARDRAVSLSRECRE